MVVNKALSVGSCRPVVGRGLAFEFWPVTLQNVLLRVAFGGKRLLLAQPEHEDPGNVLVRTSLCILQAVPAPSAHVNKQQELFTSGYYILA